MSVCISILLLAVTYFEIARRKLLLLSVVCYVLHGDDVILLFQLLFVAEHHVEHLEGCKERRDEEEEEIGQQSRSALFVHAVTDKLGDPTKHLHYEPHLKDLAAEQVLLSVQVRDGDCDLCGQETGERGHHTSDQIAPQVEAANDQPDCGRCFGHVLTFDGV